MPLNEATFQAIEQRMASVLDAGADMVVESAVEDRLALVMNGHYQVTEVHLRGLDLPEKEVRHLEDAIKSAFNDASAELARRLGEQFSAIVRDAQG